MKIMVPEQEVAQISGCAPQCPICSQQIATGSEKNPCVVTPERCDITEDGRAQITFRTKDGDLMYATMSTTALLSLVNMAVQAVNSNTAQIISTILKI